MTNEFMDAMGEFITSKKVDINAVDNEGTAPIHLSCQQYWDYVDLTVTCVYFGANLMVRDNRGRTVLHFAAARGFKYTMEYLFECKFDANVKDNSGVTPLHLAAENKSSTDAPPILLLLKIKGADFAAQEPTL